MRPRIPFAIAMTFCLAGLFPLDSYAADVEAFETLEQQYAQRLGGTP